MKITRMRQERIAKEWSQQYIADIVGLTRVAIHDIETSKQLPSYKILIKLEDLFKMNHRELLEVISNGGEYGNNHNDKKRNRKSVAGKRA